MTSTISLNYPLSIQLTTVLDYPVDVNIFEKSGVQCRTGQVISMFAHCERINIIISHKSVTGHRVTGTHPYIICTTTDQQPSTHTSLHNYMYTVHTLDIARRTTLHQSSFLHIYRHTFSFCSTNIQVNRTPFTIKESM